MAQVNTPQSAAADKHGKRASRKNLFIDLTPMVDLAFLLISFFMLTTVLEKNTAIDLHMPENTGEAEPVPESRTLTLIAAENNQLFYYQGKDPENLQPTDYSRSGVRQLLYNKNTELRKVNADKPLICIIKLSPEANYDNMVGLLDEMEITDVKTYAIQELTEAEKAALSTTLKK